MPRYLSGKNRVTPSSQLSEDRYKYLTIEQAEPNLGDPLVGPSSIGAKTVPPGQQYIIVSTGTTAGERYWIPNQGGIIPGSISVFDDGTLVGTLSSITQLNFVGAAVSAFVLVGSPNLATIRISAPGNNQELLFNSSNEFGTSSKLTFNSSIGLLSAGDRLNVGAGGTVITTTGIGSVGIGTTNPTQELHVQGDLRLTGTIYDYNNQPGTSAQVLIKNSFGGLTWVSQDSIRAGAGGTYKNVQFHNSAGLVDGAPNFVFDDITSRIGIGSTQPRVLLDVVGVSSFRGGTTIDNLTVSGVTTTSSLNVSGLTTTHNLLVTGITTVGFITGTSAYFTGIVTASKFIGAIDVTNLYVTGLSTFFQKVNINSDLGVTGLTTTQNLQVYQSTTLNRLNVSGISTFNSQVNVNDLRVTGVGTFDNIKLDTNTISTLSGNLILDSSLGTTQINDAVYVNDATQSTTKDNGSIITEGGVGIEKNLNVGGAVSFTGPAVGIAVTLAAAGGITTTGGDLYVRGNLYLNQDIYQDEIFARNGFFTGILSTRNFIATGIATIATLGVSGLTTTKDLKVIGISTFDNYIDANGGAYIDNIQIGITDNNTIDTSTGNLIISSAGNITTIDDQLIVTGITSISDTTDSSTKDNGALIVEGGVGIEKNLNVGANLSVVGVSSFNGNVILGDAVTDTVTYNSRVGSGITPSADNTHNLGSPTLRWSNIYANSIIGTLTGAASSLSITSDGANTNRYLILSSSSANNGITSALVDDGIVYNPSINSLGINATTLSNTLTVAGSGTSTSQLYVSGVSTFAGITTVTGPTLFTTQLNVSGISTFNNNVILNGNVTLGDAATDLVNYISRVGSGITPSADNTHNLGSPTLRWSNIYANNIVGNVTGAASSLNVTTDGTNIDRYLVLSSTTNGITTALVDSGIVYNPSTNSLGINATNPSNTLTVAGSGTSTSQLNVIGFSTFAGITTVTGPTLFTKQLSVSGVSTFNGNVTLGDAATDLVNYISRVGTGITPSVDNTHNLGSPTLRWSNIYATNIVGNLAGAASSLNVTTDGTNIDRYLVLSSATSGITTALVDSGIVYNPSTNSLGINATNPSNTLTVAGSGTSTSQLSVSGISTFNGNVILGNAATDLVNYISRVGSGITPSADNANDLGSSTLRWKTLYASTIIGNVTGAASSLNVTTDGANASRYLVLSSATSGITTALVDAGITYNPSNNTLTADNLTVSGTSTFNGNVILGDAATDLVNYISRVGSGITPSADNTHDLGSSTLRWKNLYASTIIGNITGNVTGAASSLNVTTDGTNIDRYLVLSSTTSGITTALVDAGITYNPSSNLLTLDNLTVSGVSTFNGNVILGNSPTDLVNYSSRVGTGITPSANNSHNLGSSTLRWNNLYVNNIIGNVTGAASSLNVTTDSDDATRYLVLSSTSSGITTALVDTGITYNPSTNILSPINLTVSGVSTFNGNVILGNAATDLVNYISRVGSGITPSVDNTHDLGSSTLRWKNLYASTIIGNVTGAASSLNVTTDTSATPRYLVLSSATSGITTALVDAGITYTPSTNLLTVSNIKPTSIQDSNGLTGAASSVLTANGSGGWSWQIPSAGITTIFVNQVNYACTNPITVTESIGITTINIQSTSNAYGRRFVQSTEPTGVCDGDIWYDTSGGGGGGGSDIPSGSVFYFAASTAPTGYLSCNGASVSTTTYAALFAAIGYTFGGSGASFNLPDLRGEFIRGWDAGRGVDSGRTFASFQADEFRSHTHLLSRFSGNSNVNSQSSRYALATTNNIGPDSTQASGGTETRPRNIALLPCIKF